MAPLKSDATRAAVINEMSAKAIQQLLELANAAPIEIIQPPMSGLTMMHVFDAFDSEFLLGEVLVTHAEVSLDGVHGFGMCLGKEADRALARACAEVLLQGTDDLLKARLQNLKDSEQQLLEGKRRREAQLVATTKVNFELMSGN